MFLSLLGTLVVDWYINGIVQSFAFATIWAAVATTIYIPISIGALKNCENMTWLAIHHIAYTTSFTFNMIVFSVPLLVPAHF